MAGRLYGEFTNEAERKQQEALWDQVRRQGQTQWQEQIRQQEQAHRELQSKENQRQLEHGVTIEGEYEVVDEE